MQLAAGVGWALMFAACGEAAGLQPSAASSSDAGLEFRSSVVSVGESALSDALLLDFEPPTAGFAVRATTLGEPPDPKLCFQLEDVVVNDSAIWVPRASVADYAEFCETCEQRVSLGAGYGLFILPSGPALETPIERVSLRVALRDCDTLLPWSNGVARPGALRVEYVSTSEYAATQPLQLSAAVVLASREAFAGGTTDPLLARALERMREIWRGAGVEIALLGPVEIDPAEPPTFAPDDRSALADLSRRGRARFSTQAEGIAWILLTPCLTSRDPIARSPSQLQGFTPHLPGSFGLQGEPDGIFVAVETCGGLHAQPRFSDAAGLGGVLAHELGHLLGLYHVREQDGSQDTLPDTSDDQPNLMQRNPDSSAIALTVDQVSVARRHLALRPVTP